MLQSRVLTYLSLSWLVASTAAAQTPAQPPADDPLRVTLPTVSVTAQKEPEDPQKLPLSVTAVSKDTIDRAGIRIVSDAALFAPNTFFTEFTARKLSNARFRGIGSSPSNPGVTTYIDGVPQLNANSSSIDLLDVQQIEFVRGPQGTLYGRNTIGGLINVTSAAPGFTKWTGGASVPFGNYSAFELRGNASGAIVPDTLAASVAFSYATRDGYTVNTITNDDLDSRDSISGKGQLLWKPAENWLARVIVTAERAEDGDYGLNDLEALRQNPHQSTRDYEGYVDRSVFATSILTENKGSRFNFATTTGFVRWTTEDSTDLDYSLMPIATRLNAEDDFQFTQEVRVSSAAPTRLNDAASLRWQAGAFFFTQNYHQDAANTFAPFVVSQFVEFPVTRYSPVAELDDVGFGLYGQGTVTLNEDWDVTAGLRFDYENKDADLKSFYDPAIAPPTVTVASDSFSNVSPQVSAAYRLQPNASVYGTIARGYKAGGFNPISPAGSEAYGQESTWNYEGGYKVRLMEDRVAINAAAFIIDWSDLQLNLPNLASPGEFYIANAGSAQSKGLEFDVTARPAPGVDVFAAFGYTHARFSSGSMAGGADVSGNEIPNTPDYTASFGAQYTRNVFEGAAYGRADVSIYGGFHYDEANTEAQDAYSLVNLRGGFRRNIFFVEGWVKNLFDINYIPVAFAYGQLAPSGFVGENGAPRTFGLRAGVTF